MDLVYESDLPKRSIYSDRVSKIVLRLFLFVIILLVYSCVGELNTQFNRKGYFESTTGRVIKTVNIEVFDSLYPDSLCHLRIYKKVHSAGNDRVNVLDKNKGYKRHGECTLLSGVKYKAVISNEGFSDTIIFVWQ